MKKNSLDDHISINEHHELDVSSLTPMMQQYLILKKQVEPALLFYQMGEFYELFFDDAIKAAKALDIVLTKRGKTENTDIPMCGVPMHSYENYMATLIKKGFNVALCNQVETPADAKKRGSKSLVKREVQRIVTPGTVTEEVLLSPNDNNFIAILYCSQLYCSQVQGQSDEKESSSHYILFWIDISTGENSFKAGSIIELANLVSAMSIAELLVPEWIDVYNDKRHYNCYFQQSHITKLTKHQLENKLFSELFKIYYGVNYPKEYNFSDELKQAIKGLLTYVSQMQLCAVPRLSMLTFNKSSANMLLDNATVQSLELVKSQIGEKKGALLNAIDYCCLSSGSRLLRKRILSPSLDKITIDKRLELITFFYKHDMVLKHLRDVLSVMPDIFRLLGKVQIGKFGPRDIVNIRKYIEGLGNLSTVFVNNVTNYTDNNELEKKNHEIYQACLKLNIIKVKINDALIDEPPITTIDGDYIRFGYHPPLDELKNIKNTEQRVILQLQEKYFHKTKIKQLKIKYNNFIGYFIEVPSSFANIIMSEKFENFFIHRQTLKNVVRFITTELVEVDMKINKANDKTNALEQILFDELVKEITQQHDSFIKSGEVISQLDVAASNAWLALRENYVRPIISNDNNLQIIKGRHPVVEKSFANSLSKDGFVANDCVMKEKNINILTGPNMAGKSTFLRQNAIIILMAQTGLYVPAQSADIGIVDRVFARIGAGDDLFGGRSTFMIEMVETSNILQFATNRSFVILDEIGRGTSTFDGMSIALAVIVYIESKVRARTLFATHYHELLPMIEKYNSIEAFTLDVVKDKDNLIFLYKIIKGVAKASFGVEVAKRAGIDKEIITLALGFQEIFSQDKTMASYKNNLAKDKEIFITKSNDNVANEKAFKYQTMIDDLSSVDLDALTPKAAHDLLYIMQKEVKEK